MTLSCGSNLADVVFNFNLSVLQLVQTFSMTSSRRLPVTWRANQIAQNEDRKMVSQSKRSIPTYFSCWHHPPHKCADVNQNLSFSVHFLHNFTPTIHGSGRKFRGVSVEYHQPQPDLQLIDWCFKSRLSKSQQHTELTIFSSWLSQLESQKLSLSSSSSNFDLFFLPASILHHEFRWCPHSQV